MARSTSNRRSSELATAHLQHRAVVLPVHQPSLRITYSCPVAAGETVLAPHGTVTPARTANTPAIGRLLLQPFPGLFPRPFPPASPRRPYRDANSRTPTTAAGRFPVPATAAAVAPAPCRLHHARRHARHLRATPTPAPPRRGRLPWHDASNAARRPPQSVATAGPVRQRPR